MLLDYEFVRLYKTLEGSIMRKLTSPSREEQEKTSTNATLTQYHEMIQQQTQQLQAYQQQEQQFTSERQSYRMKIGQLEQMLLDMQNQYSALKLTSEEGEGDARFIASVHLFE
jgi:predicted RNase H-like nuclease (RuvC/YqgF family)